MSHDETRDPPVVACISMRSTTPDIGLTCCPHVYRKSWRGKVSTNPWHYCPLIFSHHFAKAFWGEDWEYHHLQLVRHSDGPLS